MRRVLIRILILISLSLVLLTTTVVLLVSTQGGTRISLRVLRTVLPGQLSYTGVSGTLNNELSIRKLDYSLEGEQVSLNNVKLHWRILGLFYHQIWIKQLSVDTAVITLNDKQSSRSSMHAWDGNFTLPTSVYIDNIQLPHLTLITPKQERYELSNSTLQAHLHDNEININATTQLTRPTKMAINITGSGSFNDYKLTLSLTNEFTHWRGLAQGNLKQLTITTTDAQLLDGKFTLSGKIDYAQSLKYNADISAQHVVLDKLQPKIKGTVDFNAHLFGTDHTLQASKISLNAIINDIRIAVNGNIDDRYDLRWSLYQLPLDRLTNTLKGIFSGRGTLTGALTKPQISANLTLDQLRFSDLYFHKLLSSVQLSITGPNSANLKIDLQPGVIEYPIGLQLHRFEYQRGSINGILDAKGARANIDLKLVPDSHLQGVVHLPHVKTVDGLNGNSAIMGRLEWQINDISILDNLIPKAENFIGKLQSTVLIDGTLSHPTLIGRSRITQGSFEVQSLQAKANDLTLEAKTTGKQVTFDGSAKVGDGTLSVEGSYDLSSDKFATDIHVTGKDALIINKPHTIIHASPDVKLKLNSDGLDIRGSVIIPKGLIQAYDFGNTESIPDDVVVVDPNVQKATPSNFDISSLVAIKLGDDVRIDVEGLHGKLAGKLTIKDEPQKPTLAAGQLQIVDGSFEMYGTKFTIEQGKLSYSGGPINNPALNIRAIRKIKTINRGTNQLGRDDIIVGILISGSANSPKYTLFSNPSGYSQADILSYLFTGQPLRNVQGDENSAQLLLQAAALVNIGGGGKLNTLRNEVKSKLGLSELDFQTTSELDKRANRTIQHTALVLGKYLSPKLYVRYSFDVLDHTNKLNIRYFLNKNWSIQTESSNTTGGSNNLDNGVDIIYSIERN